MKRIIPAALFACALALTGCSGGDAKDPQPNDSQVSTTEAAPPAKQLSKEELTQVIESVNGDNRNFTVDKSGGSEIKANDVFKDVDVEPVECKALIYAGFASMDEKQSNNVLSSDSTTAQALGIFSFKTAADAQQHLSTAQEATGKCKDLQIKTHGTEVKFTAKEVPATIDGAEKTFGFDTTMEAEGNKMNLTTIYALVNNNLVSVAALENTDPAPLASVGSAAVAELKKVTG